MESVVEIPLTDILSDDQFNCRGNILPLTVVELARDIGRQGLIQPIVVQPWNKDGKKWRIVCGHRRYLATMVLKKQTIKSIVREDLSETSALMVNLAENVQRQDLNILQEAKAIDRFRNYGWSEARIAQELGTHTEWVSVRIDLLTLPDEIQERAAAGYLTQHQIRDIAAMCSREQQLEMTRKCVDHKIKGERGSFKLKNDPKRVLQKGDPRNKTEIFEVQEVIQSATGNARDFGAMCLAWAAGVISTSELYDHLDARCMDAGLHFVRPKPSKSAVD